MTLNFFAGYVCLLDKCIFAGYEYIYIHLCSSSIIIAAYLANDVEFYNLLTEDLLPMFLFY